MEALSKHQLILVALLVSFVTSLATGIVTVALMDQAPGGVTRTITQVIQQTVADATGAATSSAAAVVISVNDQVANATSAVTPSMVRIRNGVNGPLLGLGLIVNLGGTIMTDKTVVTNDADLEVIYPDGKIIPAAVIKQQTQSDVAFLAPLRTLAKPARSIVFADIPRLGASVWSISGSTTYALSQGIINQIDSLDVSGSQVVHSTIPEMNVFAGAPLFDATGSVVGIATKTLPNTGTAQFYSVQGMRAGIPR